MILTHPLRGVSCDFSFGACHKLCMAIFPSTEIYIPFILIGHVAHVAEPLLSQPEPSLASFSALDSEASNICVIWHMGQNSIKCGPCILPNLKRSAGYCASFLAVGSARCNDTPLIFRRCLECFGPWKLWKLHWCGNILIWICLTLSGVYLSYQRL